MIRILFIVKLLTIPLYPQVVWGKVVIEEVPQTESYQVFGCDDKAVATQVSQLVQTDREAALVLASQHLEETKCGWVGIPTPDPVGFRKTAVDRFKPGTVRVKTRMGQTLWVVFPFIVPAGSGGAPP